jgi:hypothetical protein
MTLVAALVPTRTGVIPNGNVKSSINNEVIEDQSRFILGEENSGFMAS